MALPTLLTRSKYSCDFFCDQSHSNRSPFRDIRPFAKSRPIAMTGNELIEVAAGPSKSEIYELRLPSLFKPVLYLARSLKNFKPLIIVPVRPLSSAIQLNRYGVPASSI